MRARRVEDPGVSGGAPPSAAGPGGFLEARGARSASLIAPPEASRASLAPGDEPGASGAPQIELVRIAGAGLFGLGGIHLRVKAATGPDLVYELGASTRPWAALLGWPTAYDRSEPFATLEARVGREGRAIAGRVLALAPGRATALAERLRAETPPYAVDPLSNGGSARAAELLDAAFDGVLSMQASLPGWTSRRELALAGAGSSSVRRALAELVLSPDLAPAPRAWDLAALPGGLERILDRASLDGRPVVAATWSQGRRPPSAHPISLWIWSGLALGLLVLGLALPRLVGAVWGLVAGGAGLVLAVAAVRGTGWTGFIGPEALAFLPPTHLGLAALALSGSIWRRAEPFRAAYLQLALGWGVAALAAGWLGELTPAPPALVGLCLTATGALALRARRVRARPPAGRPALTPPRAVSEIEQRSPYVRAGVRSGGLRFR